MVDFPQDEGFPEGEEADELPVLDPEDLGGSSVTDLKPGQESPTGLTGVNDSGYNGRKVHGATY